MKKTSMLAPVITAFLILIVSAATGFFGFMAWALALNGFMGNESAITISMVIYLVLAVISALAAMLLGAFATYYLAGKRSLNPVASSAISVVIFSIIVAVAHLLCVVISAIAASSLRV